MIDFLLEHDIKKRVTEEFLATDYSRANILLVDVDNEIFNITIGNDILYLISEKIDLPDTAQITFQSSDNYIRTSKLEFENFANFKIFSFRDYLTLQTRNYGTEFKPYRLEFIRITPE